MKKILAAALNAITGGGADVLGKTLEKVEKFVPDGDERAKVRSAVISEWVQAQAQVQAAQMQYGTWLTRSWRPILFLSFGFTLLWNYGIGPMCGYPPQDLPTQFWEALMMGLGMGIGGRSLEKITTMVAPGKRMKKMVEALKEKKDG
jgi:hypothetical protein